MTKTEDLLTDIRLACRLSPTDYDYTDSVLLRIATVELRLNIYPWLIALNQNYGVVPVDVPIVAGKDEYKISNRAHGATLKDLNYLDTQRNENQLSQGVFDNLPQGQGQPRVFVLLGNTIKLGPKPDSVGVLRQYINLKPSELVLSTDTRVRKVLSVDSATEITLNSPPAETSFTADVISQDSPHDLVCLSTPVSYSTSLSLSSTAGISAGDFVCKAGVSPVVQLPEELVQLLVESVSLRYFEAMNYADQMTNSNGRIDKLKAELSPLLSHRVKESPQIIISPL